MAVQYSRSDKTSKLGFTEAAVERRMIDILRSVPSNPAHQLRDKSWQMDGSISHQLIPPKIKTVRFRRSLVPTPIRHHNGKCDQILSQLTPKPRPLSQTSYTFFFVVAAVLPSKIYFYCCS